MLFLIIFFAASTQTATAHDHYPYSYYSVLMNKTKGNFNSLLTHSCKRRLRKFFRDGNTLRIPELESAKTSILTSSFRTTINPTSFYHYTSSKQVESNVLRKDVDSFFLFTRVSRKDNNSTSIYIAKDPFSSSTYGNIQVRLDFDPEATVLKYDDNKLKELVLSRFPKLSVCWGTLNIVAQENAYLNLVLEENDIDLYAYFETKDWFQIIKRTNIRDISIGTFNEW